MQWVQILTAKLTGSTAVSTSMPSSCLPSTQHSGGNSCKTSWSSAASFPHRVCLCSLGISCTTSSTSKGSVLSFCSAWQTGARQKQLDLHRTDMALYKNTDCKGFYLPVSQSNSYYRANSSFFYFSIWILFYKLNCAIKNVQNLYNSTPMWCLI